MLERVMVALGTATINIATALALIVFVCCAVPFWILGWLLYRVGALDA